MRATSRPANDGGATPPVNYYYDNASLPSGAPASFNRGYSTGRLVAVTYGSSSSNGDYRGYDELGRVVRQVQQTDGVNYLTEATYYLNSAMATETYPSVPGASDRRTVSYNLDSAARLSSLSSSATSYAPAASVSSIAYAPHNALTAETYGNNLVHAVTYNTRLQPNEIKLGTSGNPTSILDLTYSYGTTSNNGNVQSVSYSGGGLSYTQSFTYDSLNRLQTAQENSGSSWSQTNGYDQYGNRWIDYGGGNHNLSFSTTTNRITTGGYGYDSSGNLTNDGNHSYTYDAENKIKTVDGSTAYVYDGEGQRVRKLVGENLRFVYDMSGKEIAEFDGATAGLKKEYIYGSSGLVATIEPTAVNSNGTRYTTSDHLGSPRVVTKSSASVVSRHDYLPFGEELGLVGGRTTGMGYSVADGVRQKFTRKERDIETGLDYFGARYYGSTQGRFMSPDPLLSSGHLENPQTWNRYPYTLNNPLSLVDPTGLFTIGSDVSDTDREKIIAAYNKLSESLGELKAGSKAYKSIERSLARLGKPGVANGVVVTIGEVGRSDAAADTDPNRVNKGTVTITFNEKTFNGRGVEEAAETLGHEGVHADDIFKLFSQSKSMSAFLKTWNSNDTQYRSEYDAYFASAGVFQALQPDQPTSYGQYHIPDVPGKAQNILEHFDLWNPSWRNLDIREIESKQAYTIQTKIESPIGSTLGGYALKRPANFQP